MGCKPKSKYFITKGVLLLAASPARSLCSTISFPRVRRFRSSPTSGEDASPWSLCDLNCFCNEVWDISVLPDPIFDHWNTRSLFPPGQPLNTISLLSTTPSVAVTLSASRASPVRDWGRGGKETQRKNGWGGGWNMIVSLFRPLQEGWTFSLPFFCPAPVSLFEVCAAACFLSLSYWCYMESFSLFVDLSPPASLDLRTRFVWNLYKIITRIGCNF